MKQSVRQDFFQSYISVLSLTSALQGASYIMNVNCISKSQQAVSFLMSKNSRNSQMPFYGPWIICSIACMNSTFFILKFKKKQFASLECHNLFWLFHGIKWTSVPYPYKSNWSGDSMNKINLGNLADLELESMYIAILTILSPEWKSWQSYHVRLYQVN